MGTETMGRVIVTARIRNLADEILAEKGVSSTGAIRELVIDDALVDTGATQLCMPRKLIEQLGLRLRRTRPTKTAGGIRELGLYDAVRLIIQERDCIVDVSELPDECPVLIGQVPLELMDWVVDLKGQRLIGNPAHGGKWMSEAY